MLDIKFIASIAERDIDLVVLEELSVSDEFREWLAARVLGELAYKEDLGAWHSVVDSEHGESDLVFIFISQLEKRIAVLIENKIDASPQPDQAARYALRGSKGIQSGYWEEFRTCLIAPQQYLESAKQTESYSSEVSYEELSAYFSSRRFRDVRYQYKARLIQEAIQKNRRGYQPEYNEAMTKFVKAYCEYANLNFPGLCVQQAKPRPAGSTWVMFMPPKLAKNMSLCHQLTSGSVKLFISGPNLDIESVKLKYEGHLKADMSISPAGKSVAISAGVPKLLPLTEEFNVAKASAHAALEAVAKLLSLI